MIEVVEAFQNYSLNIKQYIKKSDYKMIHFVKRLGLSEPTFYRKIKQNTFTINEIVILTKILFPEEYYKHQLKLSLKRGLDDIKNNRVVDARKMIKEERNKLHQLSNQ